MKNYGILLLSIFFFSCQQKQNKEVKLNVSDTIVVKNKKQENKQIGDTIEMNYKNEKEFFIAEGSIDSIHPRIYVKIKNEALSKLNAKIITTTGKGNIRFNQIIFPDNTSDGSFGKNLLRSVVTNI